MVQKVTQKIVETVPTTGVDVPAPSYVNRPDTLSPRQQGKMASVQTATTTKRERVAALRAEVLAAIDPLVRQRYLDAEAELETSRELLAETNAALADLSGRPTDPRAVGVWARQRIDLEAAQSAYEELVTESAVAYAAARTAAHNAMREHVQCELIPQAKAAVQDAQAEARARRKAALRVIVQAQQARDALGAFLSALEPEPPKRPRPERNPNEVIFVINATGTEITRGAGR